MVPNPVPATKKDILILTIARADTRQPIHGAVQPRLLPRPVPAVLLREPVTKLRRTPTVTPALPVTVLTVQTDIPLPNLKYVPAAQPPEPAISARASPKSVALVRTVTTTVLRYLIAAQEHQVSVCAETITEEGSILGITVPMT